LRVQRNLPGTRRDKTCQVCPENKEPMKQSPIFARTYDSTAKRSSHREACEDRKENAKPQIIIQDNLRDGLTFSKRS